MESVTSPVNVLVEGVTDEAVVRRLLEYAGLTCGTVYGKTGKGALLERLPSYNQAARFAPWLVVVDLDQDAECALPFVRSVLSEPTACLHFRVAVRAVESWLLADAERLAAFLGVPVARIPSRCGTRPQAHLRQPGPTKSKRSNPRGRRAPRGKRRLGGSRLHWPVDRVRDDCGTSMATRRRRPAFR